MLLAVYAWGSTSECRTPGCAARCTTRPNRSRSNSSARHGSVDQVQFDLREGRVGQAGESRAL